MAEKVFPCPYTMMDYYKKNCVHFMYNKDKTLKNYFQMLVTALANITLQLHFRLGKHQLHAYFHLDICTLACPYILSVEEIFSFLEKVDT